MIRGLGSMLVVAALLGSACADSGAGTTVADAGQTTSTPAEAAPPATSSPEATSTTTAGAPASTTPVVTGAPEKPPATAEPAGPPKGSEEAVFQQGDIDEGLRPFIDMAIADLAGLLDVAEADIAVVAAVLVTWPDASLGCPQPGMAYAQVVTDGSVIELETNGRVYRYHTGGERGPFLCDQPLDAVPPTAGLGGADSADS